MIEGSMRITLPLSEMTVQDKLQVMDEIWADLPKHEADVSSPSWHQELLSLSAAKVERGESQFRDSASVKEALQKRFT